MGERRTLCSLWLSEEDESRRSGWERQRNFWETKGRGGAWEERGEKGTNLSTGKSPTRNLWDRQRKTKLPSLLLSDACLGARRGDRAEGGKKGERFSERREGKEKEDSTRLTSIILSTRPSSLGSRISGGACSQKIKVRYLIVQSSKGKVSKVLLNRSSTVSTHLFPSSPAPSPRSLTSLLSTSCFSHTSLSLSPSPQTLSKLRITFLVSFQCHFAASLGSTASRS